MQALRRIRHNLVATDSARTEAEETEAAVVGEDEAIKVAAVLAEGVLLTVMLL